MVDHTATARIERLVRWLERFKSCFGHRAQLMALRTLQIARGVQRQRPEIDAGDAGAGHRADRLSSLPAFHHPRALGRREGVAALPAVIPERRGVAILDGTSFPKQGPHSVGVMRTYCGALGKIANCQVATTIALWTGVRGWFLGAQLYLPEAWLKPGSEQRARIPTAVVFQEKWRHALTLLRQVRAAGFTITAVLGDAEFGDVTAVRATLHRWQLPYTLGISSNLVVFVRRPRQPRPPKRLTGPGRPRTRPRLLDGSPAVAVSAVARGLPAAAWRRVSWRNGTQPRRRARFAAIRVTPAHDWRRGCPLTPEVWLLCEEEAGRAGRISYCFVHLPPRTPLPALVALAHQRWAIEQQYRELKSKLGLDHFEGRAYPGWQHHVVLTAVAHAYIQRERMRRGAAGLAFPAVARSYRKSSPRCSSRRNRAICSGWNRRNTSFKYGSDKVELEPVSKPRTARFAGRAGFFLGRAPSSPRTS